MWEARFGPVQAWFGRETAVLARDTMNKALFGRSLAHVLGM